MIDDREAAIWGRVPSRYVDLPACGMCACVRHAKPATNVPTARRMNSCRIINGCRGRLTCAKCDTFSLPSAHAWLSIDHPNGHAVVQPVSAHCFSPCPYDAGGCDRLSTRTMRCIANSFCLAHSAARLLLGCQAVLAQGRHAYACICMGMRSSSCAYFFCEPIKIFCVCMNHPADANSHMSLPGAVAVSGAL